MQEIEKESFSETLTHLAYSTSNTAALIYYYNNYNLSVFRGLFITIHDKGHIATVLNSWPEEDIKVQM